ncbi:MAG: glycosyltransferase N-terminal domain-containing protein [Rhodoferax sp.]|uniref:3-deoxy-D-manno-octulosonic acid transferase n=1 Tax=Rhodoferax sp. TaxID=50421 RepID=UPI0027234698|nr:glycosyltransferase N-terminal domain-containing protein [Rhodoferax sp.]MDO8450890.1 glycosyltransferase N-terminal domain-containing protein [Rhodoferax sp.]
MSTSQSPSKIQLVTRVKWGLFRLLEHLSDLRGNSTAGHLELDRPERPLQSLWVFVSTIGELSAIDPLLREIAARLPQLKLVLITDHPHYRDSYLARYPSAEVCVTLGHSADATALALHYPPKLVVVAEIPCWPSDAPCRFSFAFLLQAKKAGAVNVLVNGWLYHYTPASRMDAIERRLFKREYLCAFDAIGAQTEETRQHLLTAGADASRVVVTGNIKFDAMQQPDWSAAKARSPAMLGALIDSVRPVIVAGCITHFAEQEMVLDAFLSLRARHRDALLVLAPRHPEVRERMQVLRNYLEQRSLPAVFRSALADAPIAAQTACLVLDTMGELRDFYAAATIAHVGVDHNVLEPLGFKKPVTVKRGWNTTYPSYPVYRLLMDSQTLIEVTTGDELSERWLDLIDNATYYREHINAIDETLTLARGSVARHLDLLAPWVPKDR